MKAVTRRSVLAFAFAVAALALAAPPAAATTYVPVSDQALLERASAVVEARVLSVEPAPVVGRWPATDTMIEVHRVIAGEVSGRNLLVRLPGGTRPDGSGVELYGIPRFGIGERLFLFLTPGDDGTFRVVHLMLGAFRERVVGGKRVLLRDLGGAAAVEMPGNPPLAQLLGPRDAEAFGRWVADAARGVEREPDYFLPDEEVRGVERVTGEYRLFEDKKTGRNMRWFDFDAGQDVDFYIASGGQPGFGEAETASAVRAGIGAWNGARGTNIRYRYAGATGNTSLNIIQFDNAGDTIDSSFDCSSGGVLAVGGPSYMSFPQAGPNGQQFHRIVGAGIVTNKNIQCFLQSVPNGLAQLLAHELGHTLGIHHPCGDGGKSCDIADELEEDALMYPFIHGDARGARINEDDRAAARALYPGSSGGGGPAPAAPSDLVATALSATEVELSWSDNSSDETQFRVEARTVAGGPWQRMATAGANSVGVVVAGLLPATDYAFRVQARRGTAGSAPSGEAFATTLPDAPATPGSFTGATTSATGAVLTWSDESSDETGFLIELRTPSSGAWVPVATLPPDTTSWALEPLLTGVPHSFRIRALGSDAPSLPSDVVSVTPQAPDAPCGGGPGVLCLQDRFRVTVDWNNPHPPGGFGTGTAAAFDGGQSGTFWFFDPANVELIVKVLDATGLNDHFWVFHGALTDSEYWISVLDTHTGAAKTYYNPPLDRCGEFDTAAIPRQDLPAAGHAPAVVFENPQRAEAAESQACGGDETLCLLGGRFEVEVDWAVERAGSSSSGVGRKVAGSDQTGYFWFFDQSNIELVVKVIDATAIGGGFWVFYGSLSDVGYTLEVTDTATLETKTYVNAQGNQCGQFDTAAFPILPGG